MLKKTIYYHETDCGGVVYYANYLKFFEEARTEFFRERGLSIKELSERGTMFVVARQEVDYKMPALYGDILDIGAVISNSSGVRLNFEHEVTRAGELIAKGTTIMVCVDKGLKPKAIPEEVRKRIL